MASKNLEPLKKHQESALSRLDANGGSLLICHPMGSGKTRTSVEAVEKLRKEGKATKTLVVVPASLRSNYLDNGVKKWTNSKGVILGSVSEDHPDIYDPKIPKADYYITSYDMFRKDPYLYLEKTKADTIVVDEMHNFRNEKTKNYEEMKNVRKHVSNFIGLTGTPFNNHPGDVRTLVDIVSNGNHELGRSLDDFKGRYTTKDADGTEILRKDRVAKLGEELNKWVHYVPLSAIQNAADMPKKIIEDIDVEMSPRQQSHYNFVMKKVPREVRETIRQGLPVNRKEAFHILPMLTQVRGVSNSVRYLDGTISPEKAAKETPKIARIIEDTKKHLEETPHAQVLIHSHLVEGGTDIISAGLSAAGIKHGVISGRVTSDERDQHVKDYNKGKIKVLVLSSAGTTGLNLPNTTMHLAADGHYNPAVIDQIEARGIRSGGLSHLPKEERKVHVRRYRTVQSPSLLHRLGILKKPKTVDEWIYSLADNKGELNTKAEGLLKASAKITCYHYAKDGYAPSNMLEFNEEKQKQILKAMQQGGFKRTDDYLEKRKLVEKRLHEVAANTLGDKVKTNHPLYFRVGKDQGLWNKDSKEYKIDPKLLNKATFITGDSFDYIRKSENSKKSLRSLLYDAVETASDLRKKSPEEIKNPDFLYDRKGKNYIEGHLWVPWKVDGNKIIEDKSLSKLK